MTTYLLERLKHEDGSPSSPVPSPPQSPTWKSPYVGEGEQVSEHDHTGSHSQSEVSSPPILLSGRPINQLGGFSGSTNPFSGETGDGNYSRSSPGSFFDTHMEERNRELRSNSTKFGTTDKRHVGDRDDQAQQNQAGAAKNIFKPLEDYIIISFGSFECINSSFSTVRPSMVPRTQSEGTKRNMTAPLMERSSRKDTQLSEMDAKTLLIGDFAENGSWWTGNRSDLGSPERTRTFRGGDGSNDNTDIVTLKSPRID